MENSLYQTAARILPLGAGNEVGRSCVVVRFRGSTVMFDCGVHPAHGGLSSLPFFDLIDPAEIDAVLVTHFHLDHAGALPYFTERTSFTGKVYMTHPTRAIFRWLLNDYVRVSNASSKNDLFSEKELAQCYDRIIPVDYGQEIRLSSSLTFIAYNAGHVLGAAMFLVRTDDLSLLYTGDYSREEDRHLKAAQVPPSRVDVIVAESTYGVQCHQSKEERESRFTAGVAEIVKRGGKCLLPVFALGRAQELLLILDEFWESRRDLQGVPIFYASALAKRCMAVYQTYINMMNDKIQGMAEISNPFHFKYVQSIRNVEAYEDRGPCVVMASPGMLQHGLSRDLFELWCGDKRNGCIIAGYCVEGTLAKELLCEPEEVLSLKGHRIAVRSSVDYVSFSAHVDFMQNAEFIEGCKAPEVVLVHGESSEMARLKSALVHRAEMRAADMSVHTPRNGEWVEIRGSGEVAARLLGETPQEELSGFVHVSEDGQVRVVARDGLAELGLSEMRVQERVTVRGVLFSAFVARAAAVLPGVPRTEGKGTLSFAGVTVAEGSAGVSVQWESSFERDILANCLIKAASDAAQARPLTVEAPKRPAQTAEPLETPDASEPTAPAKADTPRVPKHCLESVAQILANYYQTVYENGKLQITEGNKHIVLSSTGIEGDADLAQHVQDVFDSVAWAVRDEVEVQP
ncbi:cleavage and polyadenylation specificity factor subunit 3 [Nematocida homosporus]|uniref:cleavage and polyadenylation specificity factor subunit 3 n=1 Tax=Nematocida homosporus TaxID=1912981 RepID=UPI00221ECEEE|nr:cleavage and polyadenylation specificity factor subunit 3 [Nematocida homosporus]KAI5187009.1 cleavage and polyadenylation specificity factor subunit 3 [Nematocida homosporus]